MQAGGRRFDPVWLHQPVQQTAGFKRAQARDTPGQPISVGGRLDITEPLSPGPAAFIASGLRAVFNIVKEGPFGFLSPPCNMARTNFHERIESQEHLNAYAQVRKRSSSHRESHPDRGEAITAHERR